MSVCLEHRKPRRYRVQGLSKPGDILVEVVLLDDAQAFGAHGLRGLKPGESHAQGLCKSMHISGLDYQSIYAVMNKVFLASHPVRNDDGTPGVHSFVDGQSPWFINRWKHKHIAQIVKGGELGLIAETDESDIALMGFFCKAFKPGAFFAAADDQQIRVGVKSPRSCQLQESFH